MKTYLTASLRFRCIYEVDKVSFQFFEHTTENKCEGPVYRYVITAGNQDGTGSEKWGPNLGFQSSQIIYRNQDILPACIILSLQGLKRLHRTKYESGWALYLQVHLGDYAIFPAKI